MICYFIGDNKKITDYLNVVCMNYEADSKPPQRIEKFVGYCYLVASEIFNVPLSTFKNYTFIMSADEEISVVEAAQRKRVSRQAIYDGIASDAFDTRMAKIIVNQKFRDWKPEKGKGAGRKSGAAWAGKK